MPRDFGRNDDGQPLPAPLASSRLTQTLNGVPGVKSVANLSLEQIIPSPAGGMDLNTCHDPDCPAFGITAIFSGARITGRNAASRRAALRASTAITGVGHYKLSSQAGKQHRRVLTVFEYEGNPHTWMDRKIVECQCDVGGTVCGAAFDLLSNDHYLYESSDGGTTTAS